MTQLHRKAQAVTLLGGLVAFGSPIAGYFLGRETFLDPRIVEWFILAGFAAGFFVFLYGASLFPLRDELTAAKQRIMRLTSFLWLGMCALAIVLVLRLT